MCFCMCAYVSEGAHLCGVCVCVHVEVKGQCCGDYFLLHLLIRLRELNSGHHASQVGAFWYSTMSFVHVCYVYNTFTKVNNIF